MLDLSQIRQMKISGDWAPKAVSQDNSFIPQDNPHGTVSAESTDLSLGTSPYFAYLLHNVIIYILLIVLYVKLIQTHLKLFEEL